MSDTKIASETRYGAAPYFVFCDHASNAIPAEMRCLGIPEDVLQTHIAWDVGAGALSELITQSLAGTYFACAFSRLIIDPNRDIHSKDSIPPVSDQIPIPGNQMLSEAAMSERIHQYHEPYHEQLSSALDRFSDSHKAPYVIGIHSYTSRLMGAAEDRPWHVGLLWEDDQASARASIRYLEDRTNWCIGDNEPYDARVFNYSIDRHVRPRRLPHITLEVRQDLISNKNGVAEMALVLTDMVRSVVETRGEVREAS